MGKETMSGEEGAGSSHFEVLADSKPSAKRTLGWEAMETSALKAAASPLPEGRVLEAARFLGSGAAEAARARADQRASGGSGCMGWILALVGLGLQMESCDFAGGVEVVGARWAL